MNIQDCSSMSISQDARGTMRGKAGHCLIIAEVTEIEG